MIRPLLTQPRPMPESRPLEASGGEAASPRPVAVAGRPLPEARAVAGRAEAVGLEEGGLGDAAFDTLVTRWTNFLRYYLWDMCGEEDLAEDLLQSTWLQAWEHRTAVQDEDVARAWLFSIATNVFRVHCRREVISRRTLGRPVTLSPDLPWKSPPEPMSASLVHALGTLAPEDRQLALLIGVHGYSQREAAEVLGLSYDTGRKRWQRARDRLEDLVSLTTARHRDGLGRRDGANHEEARR